MPTRLNIRRPNDFVEFPQSDVEQGIHQRFEDQVRLYPSNIALKTENNAFTYAESNGFANSIANIILEKTGPDISQAAILQRNAPEIVFSILAAMKARKAYVPLDPNFPKERLQMMLEDAEPKILLTDDEHVNLAEELVGSRQIPILNTSQIQCHVDAPNPNVDSDPMDRAYILFTSGSTGRPKGMAGVHRNLLHSTMCFTNNLYFSASDRVTWLHSASFSASFVDLYGCLTNGATLYPWDAKSQGFTKLAKWLHDERVTTFQWIPSAFRQFLRSVPNDFIFQHMRMVVMASEPLTIREVDVFRQHFAPGSHLINQLGTSESYNYRLYPVDHEIAIENANVAGGYEISKDRQVVILDENRCELPVGESGEIGIKSDYMSLGYWKDESLTQSKFVRADGEETPIYLTGDLGKLESDGCLLHLGRKDFQVKIRGYRVELAEVDHLLSSAPSIVDSVAWVVKTPWGEDQLVGYVVLADNEQLDEAAVETYLQARLPDYMMPYCYVVLSKLPTLPTGKVNRNGLPNPFDQATTASSSDSEHIGSSVDLPPTSENATSTTEVQDKIIGLFEELLQLEKLDPESNFIKLGGSSILMALLISRIYQWYGVEIPIDQFLEAPTPRKLASLLTP